VTQDLRDTDFIRRYRQLAGWVLYVLFGLSALIGLAGLGGPFRRLVRQGEGLAWSELAGPACVLLVSLAGGLSTVGARRAHRREESQRATKRLEADEAKVG
jgi:hypothetical protein